jgi:hypothetical protein
MKKRMQSGKKIPIIKPGKWIKADRTNRSNTATLNSGKIAHKKTVKMFKKKKKS